jgi:hypothetical protein
MTRSSLAIAGTNRLAEELLVLSGEKGLAATRLSDTAALDATTKWVIDTESGDSTEGSKADRAGRRRAHR